MKYLRLTIGATLPLAVGLSGCATSKHELSRVARDWCLAIRASQIVPVYPLTEDLLPGDVYLVQTRVEDQVKVYQDKGFLPIDHLLTRLHLTNYPEFYDHAHGIEAATNTPYHWRFPPIGPGTNEMWKAPRAGFPSYSFAVKKGGGLNVALPVQGVPVALNLMRASSAKGSVTIADAYTFGIDRVSLEDQVKAWAAGTDCLAQYAPTARQTNFLRVVCRVFLTGRLNVALFNDSSAGLTASGGAAKPVELPDLITGDTSGNLDKAKAALIDSIGSAALPGGTLKLVTASSRAVSMVETFPRPLVIGYHAFDLPILEDGELGGAVSTHAVLEQTPVNRDTAYGPDENTPKLRAWLKTPGNREKLKEWLQRENRDPDNVPAYLNNQKYRSLRQQILSHFNIP